MSSVREASWAIVLLLLIPGTAPATESTHVHIVGAFDPQRVEILPGDALSWDNHGTASHTVTDARCLADPSVPCAFDQAVSPGDAWSWMFDAPGVFDYRCRIHGFAARVTVADAPGSLPDLVIEQLVAEPARAFGQPMPGSTAVEVTIANVGDGSAGAAPVLLAYRMNGSWNQIATLDGAALGPGERVVLRATWQTGGKVGDVVVRALADPVGVIPELRESNNEASEIVSLLVPPGVLPGIDLLDP